MKNCILSNMYYVPLERLPNVTRIKEEMQVKPIWFKGTNAPRPKPIPQCDYTKEGYVGFPVYYGMKTYPDFDFINQTSRGGVLIAPRRPDPNHERASKGQAKFMQDLVAYFSENFVGLAQAGTGTGKTVSALNLAAERGRSTLVITDREYLSFEQWIPEAKDKLGLSDDQIGIIQGANCEYHKPFCAGIARSIIDNEYPPEFYSAFGTVILDEVHKFGAKSMAKILMMFTAECRLGMTATTKRGDGAQRVYTDYYGPPSIVSKTPALPFQLKIVSFYDKSGEKMPKSQGLRITKLTGDDVRNKLIVKEIMELYNDNRTILVIGDNTQHLQRIEKMCWKAGVPEKAMGQFCRERYILTKHKAIHRGQEVFVKRQKKARITNEYLTWVKNHAQIIFATYGMVKEGVDISRLDAGIDITPRKEAIQVVGRIRRPVPGKRTPVWVTIVDEKHDCFLRAFNARMKEYRSEKAEILS